MILTQGIFQAFSFRYRCSDVDEIYNSGGSTLDVGAGCPKLA
jgi:hypothetical protein